MDNLNIANPIQIATYKMSSERLREHINNVLLKFPKELKIIKEDQGMNNLVILYTPLNAPLQAPIVDLLLTIQIIKVGGATEVDFLATNQVGQIQSHTEAELHKKTIQLFVALLDKSIKGTLNKAAKNNISPQLKAQATLQLFVLIAAIIAIIFGLVAILK